MAKPTAAGATRAVAKSVTTFGAGVQAAKYYLGLMLGGVLVIAGLVLLYKSANDDSMHQAGIALIVIGIIIVVIRIAVYRFDKAAGKPMQAVDGISAAGSLLRVATRKK